MCCVWGLRIAVVCVRRFDCLPLVHTGRLLYFTFYDAAALCCRLRCHLRAAFLGFVWYVDASVSLRLLVSESAIVEAGVCARAVDTFTNSTRREL